MTTSRYRWSVAFARLCGRLLLLVLAACGATPGIPGNNNQQPVCGNGVVEPPEECDGQDLGAMSCADFGFSGGTLSCTGCRIDINDCTGCGDGTCATDETRLTCPKDCGVRAVSAGDTHVCAALGDGTAWCWGSNYDGELGLDPSTPESNQPVQVPGLTGVINISAGMSHSCAVLGDGTVWCWGSNLSGALGDGTGQNSPEPVLVSSTGVHVEVSTGAESACARLDDGRVRCWGSGPFGALGNPSVVGHSLVPVDVVGLVGATSLRVGHSYACVTREPGEAWCWGKNREGELGIGSDIESSTSPVQVIGLEAVRVVGFATLSETACAVQEDGTAWCWGLNYCGNTGDGTWGSNNIRISPVEVDGLQQVESISNSGGHGCAVLEGGALRCWGLMGCTVEQCQEGQLGSGGYEESLTPLPVVGFETSGARMVSTGMWTTCAVRDDGTAWCWGYNGSGTLGAGTNINSSPEPVQVVFPD